LVSQHDFLAQGAAVIIDAHSGRLTSLPVILDNYMPDPTRLPLFVHRLGQCPNWDSEEEAVSCAAEVLDLPTIWLVDAL